MRVRRIIHEWLYGPNGEKPESEDPLVEGFERAASELEQRVNVLKALTARMRREGDRHAVAGVSDH